ncbi:hypothetical protein J0K78_03100 [Halobacillus sp. GSS1]|uniref:hypothetical protein n=1 Tax=Halobacillus sp. GSS1 TaxID=2815919 RepID=UPI001A8E02A1|nr:hypothetical protein [Halobacillus sp. GSS1]MBN9653240.1 hypothetical protein [Halobacillus sp. GSS1]
MKELLKASAIGLLIVALAACGGEDNTETSGSVGEEQKAEETTTDETETTDVSSSDNEDSDEGETMTAEENENKEAEVGDTVTSEAGEQTLVSRTDDIGEFESGPITLTIEKVNGVSGTLKGEVAEYMDMEEIEYIQVDMKVSNSSEEDVNFYASQATMTTNTGEQLEPDMMMSDHIDGEYLGQVNKEGSSFYILENSKAEDVTSVTLHYDAAHDMDFEDLGEKIKIEVELEK